MNPRLARSFFNRLVFRSQPFPATLAIGLACLAAWASPAVASGWASLSAAGAVPFSNSDLAAEHAVPLPADGNATTSIGGGTFDLNAFLGANRYYNHSTPITGQNTISYNIEAGHLWGGHETLQHVSIFTHASGTWGGTATAPKYDRHATWAAMLLGGRQTIADPLIRQQGMAPGTDLRSGAFATQWNGSAYALNFNANWTTYELAFASAFGTANVINSSYGFSDAAGISLFTVLTDALAYGNPDTLHVVSAGNSGPATNTVGSPAAGYNSLSVAALGGANSFDSVASFSSRGPQDFGYYQGGTPVVISGVRAAVDIAAPGTSITSAFYGGQTGGNNNTLTGSVDSGSEPDDYSSSINGTSFSAPLVAGGAALLASAATTLPELSGNSYAARAEVLKVLLLTGADKTSGWTNNLELVTEGGDTFLKTTQSLDWNVGAGRMNLDRTFDIQLLGQRDVAGTAAGFIATVEELGWDFAEARIGSINDYILSGSLAGDSTFTATLAWNRIRIEEAGDLFEVAQADLRLSVWGIDSADNFTTLVAVSDSLYNNVEHLSFSLPSTGRYGIRVTYSGNTFDNTTGEIWGTAGFEQEYALAWYATLIPEPSTGSFAIVGLLVLRLLHTRRRNRKS